ncbi:hypothetical protein PsYK624_125500 [Phanerochaete sordida]|uniref:Uncharacterized protein n=1 Tax=Phanerochaete sordida TaxID=48140 RepID=A0A9P3LIH0_9APHY|nr:hypothetical protein PsYK624_125500 [Phanerochaete sordida]
MPPVLIQRFMLNLRSFDICADLSTSGDHRLSADLSVQFRRPSSFLGNIGESVDIGEDGEGIADTEYRE